MKQSFWTSSNGLASMVMIGFVTYFLLVEHRDHVIQALPYIIILLCPLMHIFMHRSHGHGNHEDDNEAYKRGLEEGRREHNSDDRYGGRR